MNRTYRVSKGTNLNQVSLSTNKPNRTNITFHYNDQQIPESFTHESFFIHEDINYITKLFERCYLATNSEEKELLKLEIKERMQLKIDKYQGRMYMFIFIFTILIIFSQIVTYLYDVQGWYFLLFFEPLNMIIIKSICDYFFYQYYDLKVKVFNKIINELIDV